MKFECHVCSKAYAWEHDLKRHLKVKHGSVEQLQQQLYGTSQQQQQQQQEFGTSQQQQQEFGTSQQQQQQQQELGTSQQQQQQEFGTSQQQQQRQQQQELSTLHQQQQQELSTFQQQKQDRGDFTFKHPFTCVISGPTSCGKTYFMVQLLQLARHKIQPPPQRIIWLYKRWQPLYDVINKSVLPKVEFMKGIPLNIDRDDFIDPMVRNVIVLDDLALEASKDQRVTDLFTEGSHHRNLSVIALNQNLYISKDPTQRRNCHYLVLYNNPIDKQIISTLAKQMYPSNSKALIRHFDDAVSKPYGYLLLDLKPYTPETARMRTHVLDIKQAEKLDKNHSPTNIQTSNKVSAIIENEVKTSSFYGIDNFDKRDTMTSCDDCGVMLQNTHDLQNHVKRWCPEAVHWNRLSPANESTPSKRARYDESDTEDDMQNSEKLEHEREVYLTIASKVREQNEGKWQKRVEKYLEQGMSDSEAEEMANMKLKQDDVRAFMDRYATLIEYMLKLNGGYLHTKIINMVERLMERDISQERAIQMALRKYNHYFEEYIDNSNEQTDTEYDSNDENEGNSDNVMTDESDPE